MPLKGEVTQVSEDGWVAEFPDYGKVNLPLSAIKSGSRHPEIGDEVENLGLLQFLEGMWVTIRWRTV